MGKGTILIQPVATHNGAAAPAASSASQQQYAASPREPAPQAYPQVYGQEPTPSYAQESQGYPRQRAPMGVVLADKLINGTTGTFTLDLKRPLLPRDDTRTSLFTRHPGPPQPSNYPAGAAYQAPGPQYGYSNGYPQVPQPKRRGRPPAQAYAPPAVHDVDSLLPSMAFGNSGARIKAMRHVQFGPRFELTKYGRTETVPAFDMGAGFDFEFDTAALRPLVRLKFRDTLSLKMLPAPAIKIQKRMQLGTSGFGLRLSYECPLETINRFYQPPARLMMTLDSCVDNGMRVTHSGLEFAANKWLLNGNVRIRAAGLLRLPSELPISEDQMLVGFEMKRLGFKGKW